MPRKRGRPKPSESLLVARDPFIIIEARDVADRLRDEHDIATVMTSYHAVDQGPRLLESYLGEAVSEYDRHIEEQIDIARGK
jgi:hypothetical protein